MTVVKCPECRKSLKVNDTIAGKRVRCPGCQKPFVVPEEPVVLEEVEEVREDRITARPRRDARDR